MTNSVSAEEQEGKKDDDRKRRRRRRRGAANPELLRMTVDGARWWDRVWDQEGGGGGLFLS